MRGQFDSSCSQGILWSSTTAELISTATTKIPYKPKITISPEPTIDFDCSRKFSVVMKVWLVCCDISAQNEINNKQQFLRNEGKNNAQLTTLDSAHFHPTAPHCKGSGDTIVLAKDMKWEWQQWSRNKGANQHPGRAGMIMATTTTAAAMTTTWLPWPKPKQDRQAVRPSRVRGVCLRWRRQGDSFKTRG